MAAFITIFSSIFDTDASYVIGITYQTIDKTHISELLGGLQGWFALIIFFLKIKDPVL